MQVCILLQTDNHTSTPPLFFTGRMPFLPPNQQRQSTEGKINNKGKTDRQLEDRKYVYVLTTGSGSGVGAYLALQDAATASLFPSRRQCRV